MSDAERYAASLGCWSGPVTPERLTGGISNDNFLVDDNGRRFVVRVNGDVPEHGVLRRNDATCNRAAAAAGVAPAVYHVAPRALVVDYIDSRTLSETDVRDDAMLARIVPVLKRTHREAFRLVRGPVSAFWPFRVCRDYAFFLEENNSRMVPRLASLRQQNEALEKAVGPIDLVLGHNDLLAANFLDDGNRLWLVDWEHAGFTSPLFDLANLASNNDLSPAQQERLLESYFELPVTDSLQHRFYAMSAASLLREAMWSMVSEITSTVAFDYVAYTENYLGRFDTAFNLLKESS